MQFSKFLVLICTVEVALAGIFWVGACSGQAVQGDATYSFSNTTTYGGLNGLHIDRPLGSVYPNGIAFDYGNQFAWGMGLDCLCGNDYTGTPDLVLAYSKDTDADNLRMRADDARTALGPRVGHPTMPFQFSVEPGTANGGVAIGTYNYQYSLYLYNRGPSKRNNINIQNCYALYTDSAQNGIADLTLKNLQANTAILRASPAGGIAFYGAEPTIKPVVTGSWSDGSAQKSLLAAVVKLGLASDQTVP